MGDEWSGRHRADAHESLPGWHETMSISPAILCVFLLLTLSRRPASVVFFLFSIPRKALLLHFSDGLSFLHVFSAIGVWAIWEELLDLFFGLDLSSDRLIVLLLFAGE